MKERGALLWWKAARGRDKVMVGEGESAMRKCASPIILMEINFDQIIKPLALIRNGLWFLEFSSKIHGLCIYICIIINRVQLTNFEKSFLDILAFCSSPNQKQKFSLRLWKYNIFSVKCFCNNFVAWRDLNQIQ